MAFVVDHSSAPRRGVIRCGHSEPKTEQAQTHYGRYKSQPAQPMYRMSESIAQQRERLGLNK